MNTAQHHFCAAGKLMLFCLLSLFFCSIALAKSSDLTCNNLSLERLLLHGNNKVNIKNTIAIWDKSHIKKVSEPESFSNVNTTLDYDPIRFILECNKSNIKAGEIFTITIRAELLPISSNMLFFFKEQQSFKVKLLLPKGFVRIGGNYQEEIEATLSSEKKEISYELSGYFLELPYNECFTLLRGNPFSKENVFIKKGEICIQTKENNLITGYAARTAQVLSCDPVTFSGVTSICNPNEITARSNISVSTAQAKLYKANNTTGNLEVYQTLNILPGNNVPTTFSSLPSGVYYLTCVNECGFSSGSWGPYYLTSTTPNTPSLTSSSQTNCTNNAVTLTASPCPTGTYYKWSKNNTDYILGDEGGLIGNQWVVYAGKYKVKCATSCSDGGSGWSNEIVINPIPGAPQTTGGSGCPNTVITLSASDCNSGDYLWYTGSSGGTPIYTGQIYSFTGTVTTTLYVGCSSSCLTDPPRAAVTATVLSASNNPIVGAGPVICANDDATLTATNCNSYLWFNNIDDTEPIGQGASFKTPQLTSTRSYYVACNSNCGYSQRVSIQVTVKSGLPGNITLTHDGDQKCPGQGILLTVNNVPANSTFTWYSPSTEGIGIIYGTENGNFAGISYGAGVPGSSTFSTNTPGTYKVTISNPNYCGTVTLDKSVGYKPSLVIEALNNSGDRCVGQTSSLDYTIVSNYQGSVTVNWIELKNDGTTSPVANPSAVVNGRYLVTVTPTTNSAYCSGTAITTVAVRSTPNAPTIQINGQQAASIEYGGSVPAVLTQTGCDNGAISYYRLTGSSSITFNSESSVQTGLAVGTYYYWAICSNNSCSSPTSNTVTLTVTPTCPTTITIGATQNGVICSGNAIYLTANGCNYGTNILWSTGETTSQIVVNPTTNTTYSVTCSRAGCQNVSNSRTITVVNFAISANQTNICLGQSASLTSTGCSGTVSWSDGITGAIRIVTPTNSLNTYWATCSTGGCQASISISVKKNETSVTASNNAACPGSTAQLFYTASPPGTAINWTGPGGFNSAQASPTATLAGTYTATVSYNGCSYTATTEVNFSQPAALVITSGTTTICYGGTITLSAQGGCTGQIVWTGNNGSSFIGNPFTVTVVNTASYSAKCQRNINCNSNASNSITLSVNPFTISASQTVVCGNYGTSLSASCCNGQVVWSQGSIGNTIYLQSLTATATYNASCIVEGAAPVSSNTVTVGVIGPLQYASSPTVSCVASGTSQTGKIVVPLSGTASMTVQYRLERWNGSTYTALSGWTSSTILNSVNDGDYKLSVRGVDNVTNPIATCELQSTTLTIFCNCSFSALSSTTAITAGQQVSLWVAGIPFNSGNALLCAGSGGFEPIEDEGAVKTASLRGTFTWEAWVKPSATLSNDNTAERYALFPNFEGAYLGKEGLNAANFASLGIAVGQNGIRIIGHTSGYLQEIAKYSGTINGWKHIAVVFANNVGRLYIDGQLQTLTVNTNQAQTTDNKLFTPTKTIYPTNYITGLPWPQGDYGHYQGAIDEVRLWSTARTVNEILRDYKRPLDGQETGLRSYWQFESVTNGSTYSSAQTNEWAKLTGGVSLSVNGGYNESLGAPTSTFVWTRVPASAQPLPAKPSIVDEPALPNTTVTYRVSRLVNGLPTSCSASVSIQVNPEVLACACQDCDNENLTQANNPTKIAGYIQSNDQNYVVENIFLTKDAKKAAQSITYLDGLGRPIQKVQVAAGGYAVGLADASVTDLVMHTTYDNLGRETVNYLPVALETNNGVYRSGDMAGNISTFYAGLNKNGQPYTSFTFEASPLDRVVSQIAPGNTSALQTVIRTNTANEVKALTYAPSTSIVSIGTYAEGSLQVTQITNENGYVTTEYKDLAGRVICRDVSGRKTYYCFDDAGLLRCVIPPNASTALSGSFNPFTNTSKKNLVFAYHYNARGLLVAKQVPGAGITQMEYDNQDRLISVKDAKNQTVITTYDVLDRVISTSIAGGQLLTRNYYDIYGAEAKAFNSGHSYESTVLAAPTGLLTTNVVGILGSTSVLVSSTYYDGLGRTVQTVALNQFGSLDYTSTNLDFIGRAINTRLTTRSSLASLVGARVSSGSSQTLTLETRTGYDRAGRVTAICQRIKDGESAASGNGLYWEPVARNSYNSLGELVDKTLGCQLQSLDYRYQMQGWLTQINNPTIQIKSAILADKSFWGMQLGYDQTGNITSWDWRTAQKKGAYTDPFELNVNEPYSYTFTYDNLSRLITGTLNKSGQSFYKLTGLVYDDNGNIKNLTRQLGPGSLQTIDELNYQYIPNTNQLSSVSDASGITKKAFYNSGSSNYTFDENGNLLRDTGKGITTDITYNILNLPDQVQLSTGFVSYTYAANGQKLSAVFPGGKRYAYNASLVYEGEKLEFIPTAEGRILPPGRAVNKVTIPSSVSNTFYRYEYHLKDHLGDLRIACRCAEKTNATGPGDAYPPIVVQEVHYDPFGVELFSASAETADGETSNRFKFNGKEEEQALGWIDFKWRHYDPTIARFFNVDRLAEDFMYMTPYQFASNDPVGKIELDGLEGISSNIAQPWTKVGSDERYKYIPPSSGQAMEGSKIGVSGTSSLGLQAGELIKVFGVGMGAYVNAGSVDILSGQLDLLDGNKAQGYLNPSLVFKQGAELQAGVIGVEFSMEKTITKNVIEDKTTMAISIGSLKGSYEEVSSHTYANKKLTKVIGSEKSNGLLTIAESKVITGFGAKMEAKQEVTLGGIGRGTGRFIDRLPYQSKRDATRVDTKLDLKK